MGGETPRNVILVPGDFEPASLRALGLANELCPCVDARVVLLHAYVVLVRTYPGLSPSEALPGVHMEVAAAAKRALDRLAVEQGGLSSILAEGDPAQAILDAV